jgi:hypothetical protein
MSIQVYSYGKTPYPPTGRYMYTPPILLKFDHIKIIQVDVSKIQLRPPGMHSPRAEADILGRLKAIAEGRAMSGKGINIANR